MSRSHCFFTFSSIFMHFMKRPAFADYIFEFHECSEKECTMYPGSPYRCVPQIWAFSEKKQTVDTKVYLVKDKNSRHFSLLPHRFGWHMTTVLIECRKYLPFLMQRYASVAQARWIVVLSCEKSCPQQLF